MLVSTTDIQDNFGKYLNLAASEEIVITQNGLPVARLLGMQQSISFLSDRLVGILPQNVDELAEKSERLERQ